MSSETESVLAGVDMVKLVSHYGIQLKKQGNNYVGLCVAHKESTASMVVYQEDGEKGHVHCYSGNCGFHEDAAGFIEHMERVDFKQAIEILKKSNFTTAITPAPIPEESIKPAAWETIKPPAGQEPNTAKNLGPPLITWRYLNESGELLGLICRYDNGGKKTFRPWTYGRLGASQPYEWKSRGFSAPKPLYGLDKLAKRSDIKVVLVEGEKAAEAGQTLLPGMVVMTWPGGSNGEKQVDWSPLKGRSCILIPDADEPGRTVMNRIAKLLVPVAEKVAIIDTSDQPEGWDLADALHELWDTPKTIAWARERLLEATLKDNTTKPALRLVDQPKTVTVQAEPETVVEGNIVSIKNQTLELNPEMPPEFSDAALAEAWTETIGRDWRYTTAWGKWHWWDDTRWRADETKSALNKCQKKMIEAANWPSAGNLSVGARRSLCSKGTISNVLALAGCAPEHATIPDEWDTNQWLLGTPGGTVDLKTGLITAPAREDKITKVTAVAPALESTDDDCSVWISILERATHKDATMIDYLQRWCGYMLTGNTREECFMFVHGPGGSGKSTFVRNLALILGDYAKASNMEAFMERKTEAHSTEIAKLVGSRLVTATETRKGGRWNEARIKALTGRDKIAARLMRADEFEYMPQFKLLIAGNHKPALRSVGEEMRRRLHVVGFPDTIPDAEKIYEMDEKLAAEYPAILAWCIRGCLSWQKMGLSAPEPVIQATKDYLEAEDTMGAWMDECCNIGAALHMQTSSAYHSYQDFISAAGEGVCSQKRFSQDMAERGFIPLRCNGQRHISGFMVKVDESKQRNFTNDF